MQTPQDLLECPNICWLRIRTWILPVILFIFLCPFHPFCFDWSNHPNEINAHKRYTRFYKQLINFDLMKSMSKRKWFGNSKKVWRRNSNKIEEFSKKWGQHPIIAPWSRRRTKTSLVRSCISILVIRSEKHEYEASGLGCHPKTMFLLEVWNFVPHQKHENPSGKIALSHECLLTYVDLCWV